MKKIISIVYLYAFPALVMAAEVTNADSLFSKVNTILKLIIPMIVSIAVIWFVYNAFVYMIAGDEEKKAAAKSSMIYGIVALFVMVSVWGLVNILTGTFDLDNSIPSTPTFDFN